MTIAAPLPSAPSPVARILRLAALVAVLCLPGGPGSAASSEDQDACRPDVFRLCASSIPDEAAIVACLDANLPSLVPACRRVIDPTGAGDRSAPVPRGSRGPRPAVR